MYIYIYIYIYMNVNSLQAVYMDPPYTYLAVSRLLYCLKTLVVSGLLGCLKAWKASMIAWKPSEMAWKASMMAWKAAVKAWKKSMMVWKPSMCIIIETAIACNGTIDYVLYNIYLYIFSYVAFCLMDEGIRRKPMFFK
jgi:hypothetical protein